MNIQLKLNNTNIVTTEELLNNTLNTLPLYINKILGAAFVTDKINSMVMSDPCRILKHNVCLSDHGVLLKVKYIKEHLLEKKKVSNHETVDNNNTCKNTPYYVVMNSIIFFTDYEVSLGYFDRSELIMERYNTIVDITNDIKNTILISVEKCIKEDHNTTIDKLGCSIDKNTSSSSDINFMNKIKSMVVQMFSVHGFYDRLYDYSDNIIIIGISNDIVKLKIGPDWRAYAYIKSLEDELDGVIEECYMVDPGFNLIHIKQLSKELKKSELKIYLETKQNGNYLGYKFAGDTM